GKEIASARDDDGGRRAEGVVAADVQDVRRSVSDAKGSRENGHWICQSEAPRHFQAASIGLGGADGYRPGTERAIGGDPENSRSADGSRAAVVITDGHGQAAGTVLINCPSSVNLTGGGEVPGTVEGESAVVLD